MCIKRNFFFYLCSLFFITAALETKQYYVDVGENFTLPCGVANNKDVMWVREGRKDQQSGRLTILDNGSLFLSTVDRNDSGVYICSPENVVSDDVRSRMQIKVRTAPPPLINVTVRPSTILALLLWKVEDEGGYPIIHFTAEHRLANVKDEWKPISPIHISPNSRQLEVYKLEPNTTYDFRIWAANHLGNGEIVEVESTTRISVEELELARHLLAGVEDFDPRIWVLAAAIVMGSLVLLGLGTCFLLYQEYKVPGVVDEDEVIELVPNIILNPGFDGSPHTEHIPPDENSNNETTTRLNNNTVVQPRNI